ncbi:DUF1569 domain-containing protein [Chryseobacterium taklimakanense]|uniref:DUF1569 domain-containing protein n=1 Tax=Chryseobacterium taklimakanense TaxID=536441 RepID=UPI001EF55F3A|nr:DUF1569 domain-containing protein [Chryseobacterium taklimakanense]MCG7280603.1 DUF1569 domain-containing protein [Chryseobacterium taklimakanense]
MKRKTLLHPSDLLEIKQRLSHLTECSEKKWGKMKPSQMLRHCDRIIQISTGKIILPKINWLFRAVGIITKKEMRLLNNGIPHNMPTFKCVVITENCNFEKAREELLATLEDFLQKAAENNLLSEHALFGTMNVKDWGFMHYKHLNHHLKQFGL